MGKLFYYELKVTSANRELDSEWNNKSWSIETKFQIQKKDIISFNLEYYSAMLLKDYNTLSFKVIKRVFILDSEHDSIGGIMTLFISPMPNKTR